MIVAESMDILPGTMPSKVDMMGVEWGDANRSGPAGRAGTTHPTYY